MENRNAIDLQFSVYKAKEIDTDRYVSGLYYYEKNGDSHIVDEDGTDYIIDKSTIHHGLFIPYTISPYPPTDDNFNHYVFDGDIVSLYCYDSQNEKVDCYNGVICIDNYRGIQLDTQQPYHNDKGIIDVSKLITEYGKKHWKYQIRVTGNIHFPKNKEIKYKPINKAELKILILDNVPLYEIDTSLIDDMSELFMHTKSIIYEGISDWDVSNVTNMAYMFSGSDFNTDISKWNVSKVKNMTYMFSGCPFNKPIGNWDVSNVESMYAMFYDNMEFNQDISKWNVSKVKNMQVMFKNTNFNGDISNWDVSNVENMLNMFEYNRKFDCDLSKWNFRKAFPKFVKLVTGYYGNVSLPVEKSK